MTNLSEKDKRAFQLVELLPELATWAFIFTYTVKWMETL